MIFLSFNSIKVQLSPLTATLTRPSLTTFNNVKVQLSLQKLTESIVRYFELSIP